MIINENNKNTILKGTVKRGFNQDPNELKEKFYTNPLTKLERQPQNENKQNEIRHLRETMNAFRRLKWILSRLKLDTYKPTATF